MSRILIVEDSPTQAQQLAYLLEDAGGDVEVAHDAETGFERAIAAPFDLLLTDLNLPGASGFDLCRKIKADERTHSLPVIVLTSQADPVNVLRGLEAGADGFMTKDRSAAEIVRRVQRTLAGGARQETEGGQSYSRALFLGQHFRLTATREQLLNVLLSAFEDVIDLNNRYRETEAALRQANGDLRRTNDALEEANQVKDKFLGIAAHDLRNPLAVIHGMSSLLLEGDDGPLAPQQTEWIGSIRRNAETMLHLLRDLLDISALRAGKLEVNPVLQNPIDLLRQAFDSFVLQARKKGVDLCWSVPDTLPAAEFDFNRLLEVFSNLLSNAIKFSASGQSVEFGAREAGKQLEVWTRDTGQGIREEELPRLFEPFARLSSQPTGGEKSTGLGLSIAKEIVDLHQGRFSVESTVGAGTTFTVHIPLRHPNGTH